MAKQKYVYNPSTLSFEKFKLSWQKRLGRTFLYILSTAVMAIVFVVIIFQFFGSPKERMQEQELAYLKLQYEILNDKMNDMNTLLADMQGRDDDIYRVIFEAEPISSAKRKAGYGGVDRYDNLYGYKNSDMVISLSKKLDIIASQLYVQSKSYDELLDMAKNKADMLSSIPAIQPVRGTDIYRISSFFGVRTDPVYKVSKMHDGLDYSAPVGTGIYATGDGKVILTEVRPGGYGNNLIIDHGYGYKTRYAHVKEFKVKKGDKVKRGQLIATVGNTGKSTGPHLHYEVLKDGKHVNPIHFFFNDITPQEYEQILELSMKPSQTMD